MAEPRTTPAAGHDTDTRSLLGPGAKRARSISTDSTVEDDDVEGSFHTTSRSPSMEPDRKVRKKRPQDTTRTKAALPEERGYSLPPKPPSTCQDCWDGPIATQYGLFEEGEDDDPSPWNWVHGYSFSTSWAALKAGASAGCSWCQFVYATRGEQDDPQSTTPVSVRVGNGGPLPNFSPKGTQAMYICIDDEPYFGGYVYTAADNSAALHIVARRRILDVASPHALSLAKAYSDECLHDHPSCIALAPIACDSPLPTRLVDCSDPNRPRLATTDGAHGKYVELSYVWGEAQPHRTVMKNLSAYADRIGILPQTIRDAIQVTYELGLQYLWTDSLCIIQDSDEDKRRELGRMHRIYRDAHLTIIAASANKVSEGFLQTRPAAPWSKSTIFPREIALPFICPPSTPLSASGTESPTATLGKVYVCPTYTRADNMVTNYSHAWEPISARGWCLQEYLMSPRSLIYTSQTLQFRCQTATQNIGGAVHEAGDERRLPDTLFLADAPPSPRDSKEWLDVRKSWMGVVEDYTRRTIGVSADKLVACSAIATEFQCVLSTDYLAGLWRDTLLIDLLWHKEDGADIPRPPAYRAPSWSWAAVDGKVALGHGLWLSMRPSADSGPVAEVVRCEVTLEDTALPFGQVTGGTLTLRAALVRCVLGLEEGVLRLRLQSAKPARDCAGGEDTDGGAEVCTEHVGWAYLDSDADMDVEKTWAVPLMRDEMLTVGLVIALVDSGSSHATGMRRVFRRVGFFDLNEEDGRGFCQSLQDRELVMSEIAVV